MKKHLSLKFLIALVLLIALPALPAYAQNGQGRGLERAIEVRRPTPTVCCAFKVLLARVLGWE